MARMASCPNVSLVSFNEERISSFSVEGMRRMFACVPVTSSTTVMEDDCTSGPVMANGERDRPFRRHASAAAVAMGPGIPFTMTRISSEDAIGREVVNA